MSSSAAAEDRGQRMIHTAGCVIIGDEVLGGKVRHSPFSVTQKPGNTDYADRRYEFRPFCQVLLLTGHATQANRSHRR